MRLTTISFRSRLTAKKNEVTTHPNMAAMTGMAAEIDPITSSSAWVTHDAPDLPICTRRARVIGRVMSHELPAHPVSSWCTAPAADARYLHSAHMTSNYVTKHQSSEALGCSCINELTW